MRYANGVDFVWFWAEYFFEENTLYNQCAPEGYGFSQNQILTKDEWQQFCVTNNITSFYLSVMALIDFTFLRGVALSFLNKVIHEDHNFGLLLMLQCRAFYMLCERLYRVRVRPNSITRFDSKNPHIVPYCKPIYEAFGDAKLAKQYHIASSWFLMLLELLEFLKARPQEEREFVEQYFISHYIHQSLKLFSFTKDPLNLLSHIHAIEPKKGFRYRYRVRLESVEKYKLMYPLFRCYDCIRSIERTLRRLVKGKKW